MVKSDKKQGQGKNMNIISIAFHKKELYIKRKGQEGTEIVPELDIEKFREFFIAEMMEKDYDSYSWDFENETVTCNGSNYEPLVSYPFIGLKDRYNEFLEALEYEEVKGSDILDEINKMLWENAINQAVEDLLKGGNKENE